MEEIIAYRMQDLAKIEILVEGELESWCKTLDDNNVVAISNDNILKLEESEFKALKEKRSSKFMKGDLAFVIKDNFAGPVFVEKAGEVIFWYYDGEQLKRCEPSQAILLSRGT